LELLLKLKRGKRLVLILKLIVLKSIFTLLVIIITFTKMPLYIIAFYKGHKTILYIIKTITKRINNVSPLNKDIIYI
jgi:hypothetical protein